MYKSISTKLMVVVTFVIALFSLSVPTVFAQTCFFSGIPVLDTVCKTSPGDKFVTNPQGIITEVFNAGRQTASYYIYAVAGIVGVSVIASYLWYIKKDDEKTKETAIKRAKSIGVIGSLIFLFIMGFGFFVGQVNLNQNVNQGTALNDLSNCIFNDDCDDI